MSVIDVAAIAEAAAVAEPMRRNDCVGMVHEARRLAPSALIEIAGSALVVARVGDMAAMRGAADRARPVAMGDEIGDQRPEPVRQVACHHDRSGRGGDRHHSAAPARQGRMGFASIMNVSVVPVGGVVPVMVMGGLGLDGAQG